MAVSYCFIDCNDCVSISCPIHPHHEEAISVRDMMDEPDEKTAPFSRLTWSSATECVSISLPGGGFKASEFISDMVKPLMLAMGYHPDTVSEALCEDEEGA